MKKTIQFFFVLLAAGEVLKIDTVVTAQKIQDFIQNDDAFGVRIPLDDCRLALRLLKDSGFLIDFPNSVANDAYIKSTVTANTRIS